nr:hypothetical protein [Halobellus clavatus]
MRSSSASTNAGRYSSFPLVVFLVHLVRVALPTVEDAIQFTLLVERVDQAAVDDPCAEVAGTA